MTVDLAPLPDLCQQHAAGRGSLVMLLQDIQRHYGYLPREAIKAVNLQLDVPLAQLYGLATFYRSFSLTPRGKHELCVCTGTACHVRGAATILEHLQRRLQVAPGGTTVDGQVTLVTVNCVGACALGPVLVMDGKYHGKATVATTDDLLGSVDRASGENQ